MSIKCKHDCKDTTILDLLSHYSYFRFEFFVHRLFFLHFTLFYFISYFIFTQLTLGLDNMTHIFLFVSHLIHHSLLFCILSAWIYFIVLSLTLRFAILKRSRYFRNTIRKSPIHGLFIFIVNHYKNTSSIIVFSFHVTGKRKFTEI